MFSYILFDLDGTLTDPREGITKSVQYALDKMGIHESDLTALEHFIGPPLYDEFRRCYRFDDAQAKQAVAFYRERFSAVGWRRRRSIAGAARRGEEGSDCFFQADGLCRANPASV